MEAIAVLLIQVAWKILEPGIGRDLEISNGKEDDVRDNYSRI